MYGKNNRTIKLCMFFFYLSYIFLFGKKIGSGRLSPPLVGTKYRTFPTFESLVPHVSYHFPTLFALSRPLVSSVSNLTFQLFCIESLTSSTSIATFQLFAETRQLQTLQSNAECLDKFCISEFEGAILRLTSELCSGISLSLQVCSCS